MRKPRLRGVLACPRAQLGVGAGLSLLSRKLQAAGTCQPAEGCVPQQPRTRVEEMLSNHLMVGGERTEPRHSSEGVGRDGAGNGEGKGVA